MTQFIKNSSTALYPDGWVSMPQSFEYLGSESPTFYMHTSGDVTGTYSKGMKVQCEQELTPTAYWRFASSAPDVGSFVMTDIGTPTYTSGKFVNALTLGGSAALQITDTSTMKPTGDFTIGCWFKTSTTGVGQVIFQSYSVNTYNAGIFVGISTTNKLVLVTGKNSGTTANLDFHQVDGINIVTDGIWHHLVVTVKNNWAQVYLDGKIEVARYVMTPVYAATNYIRIGCQNLTGSNVNYFTGQIDDFLYLKDYAIDEQTIAYLYNGGTGREFNSALTNGTINLKKHFIITDIEYQNRVSDTLTSYWRFNESSGNAADYMETNNATAVNTPTFAAGKFDNAVTLVSASSQCFTMTDSASLKPVGDFSIGAWFKTSSTGVTQSIIQNYSANSNVGGYWLGIDTTNKLSAIVANYTGVTANANLYNILGPTTVTDGAWHQVTFTFKGQSMYLYLDGKLEVSRWIPIVPAYNATTYPRIGAQCNAGSNSNFFNGQLDDLFLMNGYALSQEQVYRLYLNNTPLASQISGSYTLQASGMTVISLYGGTDFALSNAPIRYPKYSFERCPYGFNLSRNKWSHWLQDFYTRSVDPAAGSYYNLGSLAITAPKGDWICSTDIDAYSQYASAGSDIVFNLSPVINGATIFTNLVKYTYGYYVNPMTINLNELIYFRSSIVLYLLAMSTVNSTLICFYANSNTHPITVKFTCPYI